MSLTTYTYSVQNDFPNQQVDIGALDSEIRNNPNITTELDGVAQSGDIVDITFINPLSLAEETELDNIVANHQGVAFLDTPQRITKLAEVTNNSTTFVDGLILAPGQVKGGNWQITWYSEIAVESVINLSGVIARLTWNGTERAMSSSDSDFYQSFSGSGLITLQDGDSPVLKLQFKRVGANNTAKIRRCQIAMILEDI